MAVGNINSPQAVILGLFTKFMEQLKKSTYSGQLHYLLLGLVLLISLISYDNQGYEIYIFGSIAFLGLSYYLFRQNVKLKIAGNLSYLLLLFFDIISSYTSLTLKFEVLTLLLLLTDLASVLTFLIFIRSQSRKAKNEIAEEVTRKQ